MPLQFDVNTDLDRFYHNLSKGQWCTPQAGWRAFTLSAERVWKRASDELPGSSPEEIAPSAIEGMERDGWYIIPLTSTSAQLGGPPNADHRSEWQWAGKTNTTKVQIVSCFPYTISTSWAPETSNGTIQSAVYPSGVTGTPDETSKDALIRVVEGNAAWEILAAAWGQRSEALASLDRGRRAAQENARKISRGEIPSEQISQDDVSRASELLTVLHRLIAAGSIPSDALSPLSPK